MRTITAAAACSGFLLNQVAATLTKESQIEEILKIGFDLTFSGGNYECIDVYSSGSIQTFNVSTEFYSPDATEAVVPFVAVLKYTSAEVSDCIQVGKFNYVGGGGERCTHYFDWPASWSSTTGVKNGTYAAVVDVSSANYLWPEGDYTVCFGDGNTESTVETFQGSASFPNIVTLNSPIEVVSEYEETVAVDFDLAFNGGQYVCVESWASGSITNLEASITWTSTDPDQTSLDFVAVVKFNDAQPGHCIQIGKFQFIGGDGERCDKYFDWPDTWNTGAKSGETFTANIDVSSASYSFPTGPYQLCFGDGNTYSTYETFVGSVSYPGLVSEPVNEVKVASAYGQTLDIAFDVTFTGGDYRCITSYAEGGLIESVQANLVYSTQNPNQTSTAFATVIKFTAAEVANCIQVGTFEYIGGNAERCDNYFDWPDEWTNNAVSGETFTAVVDVSSAKYNFPTGDYTVCVGDGQTDSTYDTYTGDVSFPTLKSAPEVFDVVSHSGETLAITFDLTFSGGEYVCLNTFASGGIKNISATLNYLSTDLEQTSVDYVTVIKYSSAEIGNCIQVGKFNFIGGDGERCNNYFDWPTEWNTDARSGNTYTANVDVSSANYVFPEGEYTICMGDGNVATAYDTYIGNVTYPGLITKPKPLVVTSEIGETLTVSYDLEYTGGEYTCITTYASGDVNLINASFLFSSETANPTSTGFVAVIKYATAQVADCIQIGTIEYIGGPASRCTNLFQWPANWNTDVTSDTRYSALVDVSSAEYSWPAGDYQVCIADGSSDTTYNQYNGFISFADLVSSSQEVIEVISEPGQVVNLGFDLVFSGGEYFCNYNVYADGSTINFFNASLVFTSTDPLQTSVDFVAVIKYNDADVADCIQVGKFNYFGGNGERCNNYFDWPTNWNQNAVSGASYSALVDVSTAKYTRPAGYYTVCFGDGNTATSTFDTYQGSISFPDLKSVAEPDDVSSTDDFFGSTTNVIIIAVVIPLGIIILLAVFYFVWFKKICKSGEPLLKDLDSEDVRNPIRSA